MRIFVSASARSADQLAGGLVEAFARMVPARAPKERLDVFGVGGSVMQAAGVSPLLDCSPVDRIGFVDALAGLWAGRDLLRRAVDLAAEREPDLVVTVDGWSYHTLFVDALKKRLGKRKQPVFAHLAAPQVWMWWTGRAARASHYFDVMLCLFPFEVDLFERAGMAAHFVGHPVLDCLGEDGISPESLQAAGRAWRVEQGLEDDEWALGVFMGSRPSWIKRNGPYLLEAAKQVAVGLRETVPASRTRIFAPTPHVALIRQLMEPLGVEVTVPEESTRSGRPTTPAMLEGLDGALTMAGTITLELASHGVPMVAAARLSPISAFLFRMIKGAWGQKDLPFMTVVNHMAGERLHPEWFQEAVTPENISRAFLEQIKQLPGLSSDDHEQNCPRHQSRLQREVVKQNFRKLLAPTLTKMQVPTREAAMQVAARQVIRLMGEKP